MHYVFLESFVATKNIINIKLMIYLIHYFIFDLYGRPENIVQYRIGWTYDPNANNMTDPINATSLKENLREHIKSNNGFLFKYKVPEDKIYSKSEWILLILSPWSSSPLRYGQKFISYLHYRSNQ